MRLRGKRVIFSRKDLWNLDEVLIRVIAAGVKKFHDTESDFKGFPPDLNSLEEFQSILKFIYESLEAKEPEYHGGFHEGPEHHIEGEGLKWDMRPNNQEQWDDYMKQRQQYFDNKQQALNLFAKYVQSMWW